MNRYDALYGALVADAASVGLHWLYDPIQIESLSLHGEILFRTPDPSVYEGKRGGFVHAARRAGELSHYGESARIVADIVFEGPYSVSAHQQQFFKTFGPCGSFIGYADRPTKHLISRMVLEGDQIPEASGMDDNQMPAFCVFPALVSANQSLDVMLQSSSVISTNTGVLEGISIVHQCAELLAAGETLQKALYDSAHASNGDMGKLMQQSIEVEGYQPVDIGEVFGRACYVHHALPVIWHLLHHAESFEQVVRDNIRCGGDSCGRSMVLGAIAGLVFGLPDSMIKKVANGSLPSTRYN